MMTLKAARVNKNLTQAKSAEKLGISVDTLAKYERGDSFPNVQLIEKMTDLYGVSYDEIRWTH